MPVFELYKFISIQVTAFRHEKKPEFKKQEVEGRKQEAGGTHPYSGIEARTLYTFLRDAARTRCTSEYNSFFKRGSKPRTKVLIDTPNLLPPAS